MSVRLAPALFAAIAIPALLACAGAGGKDEEPSEDADGDGVPTAEDCDDGDPAVGPSTYWYVDADLDGFGNGATGALACTAPGGSTDDGTDCDDTNAAIHPGVAETCNDLDDDCDGTPDDDATDAEAWFEDADGDGFGDAPGEGCDRPATAVDVQGDCDDDAYDVNPEALEVCNGADDDCDGTPDDDAIDAGVWYSDGDADGYGDDDAMVVACSEPTDVAERGGDCDDGDAASHPGAAEACDGTDGDCDGDVDDGACPCDTWTTGGHGYQFCDGGASWESAKTACAADGYDLVTVDDATEGAWLYDVVASEFPSERDFWIGLSDSEVEGTWRWASGAALSYTAWQPGEPSGGTEDCAAMGYFWTDTWNDSDCALQKPYICESR